MNESETPFHDYVAVSYNAIFDATEKHVASDGSVEFTFYAVARIDMVPQTDQAYALYGETPTKILFNGMEKVPSQRYYGIRDCPDTITVKGEATATLSLRFLRASTEGMDGSGFYVAGLNVTSVNQTPSVPRSEDCWPPVAFYNHMSSEFSLPSYAELPEAPSTLTADGTFSTNGPAPTANKLLGNSVYAHGLDVTSKDFTETLKLQKLSATKDTNAGDDSGGDTGREKIYLTTIEETANGARIVVKGVHQGVDITVNLPPAVAERTMVDGADASVEGPIEDGALTIVWVDKPPVTEEKPPGTILGYFGVTEVNMVGMLTNIKLRFHTLKTSVEEGVANLVSLFSYDEAKKTWEKLPTRLLGAEGDANQYEADVNHFSYFAFVLTEAAPPGEDAPSAGLILTWLVSIAVAVALRPGRRP